MIKEVKHGVTYCSKLNYPNTSGLVQKIMNCAGEGNKVENVINLKITTSYIMVEIYNGNKTEVLKSQTAYTIITDGSINLQEVYQVFHHAMTALIVGLNRLEAQNGIHQTTDLHPLLLEDLQQDIQPIVDSFQKG